MASQEFSPFNFARLGSSAIRELTKGLDALVAGRLWVRILLALFGGVVFGLLLGPEAALISSSLRSLILPWLAIPGTLFLSLIQLVIIPLVFSSVVLGVISSDSLGQLKRLGLRIVFYYLFTTLFSITLGFLVAFLIQPGRYMLVEKIKINTDGIKTLETTTFAQSHGLGEILTNIIPANPFDVLASGEMLQVVSLAIFLGIALMSLKDKEARPVVDLLGSFQKLSMIVISWAMKLAPLAVFSLTAKLLGSLGMEALMGLGVYIFTVLLGLFLVFLFYLLLIFLFTKTNPLEFLSSIRSVQLLAFSTSSSASVMPLTIEVAEKKLGVRSSISQFVIPLGATVNMDGTALYQGVATIFLAQAFGIDLSFTQLALVVLTATLSSIGAPGAPGVGIGILSVLLTGLGIPPAGIMILLGVDRILDMARTVINVTGDLTAALVLDHLDSKRDLTKELISPRLS